MWTHIVNEGQVLQWVDDSLSNGTAVWMTDRSYNPKVAPTVSGAGWILYCTEQKCKLYGSFFERSPRASSYRGKLLGLLAIHTFAVALEEAYIDIPTHEGTICCDNQGALHKSADSRRRIPVGASEADIKRAFRTVKAGLRAHFKYEWVESHQDRYKLWFQLSLVQQLNCLCDSLAKSAVAWSIEPGSPDNRNPHLPRESAAIYIRSVNQTSNVANDLRFALGLVDAERFYNALSASSSLMVVVRRGAAWAGLLLLSAPSTGGLWMQPCPPRAKCTSSGWQSSPLDFAAPNVWWCGGIRRETGNAPTAAARRQPPT